MLYLGGILRKVRMNADMQCEVMSTEDFNVKNVQNSEQKQPNETTQ